ncbi:MAG: AI-2E family transporter [Armatimonadota bacterium]
MKVQTLPRVILAAGILGLLWLAVAMAVPFLAPMLWAAVLAILMLPMHRIWAKRWSPSVASGLSTIVASLLICLPLLLIVSLAVRQISPALNAMEGTTGWETADRIDKALNPILEKVGMHDFHLRTWWEENGAEITQNLRAPATKFAKSIGNSLFMAVVLILSMFFFLKDGKSLREPFLRYCGLEREWGEKILSTVEHTTHAVFRGSVLVAMIQGFLMGITFAFLGVPNSILLGVVAVLMCLIPILGAPVLYVPVGLLFLAQGDVKSALTVLGVGVLVISQIDNVLKSFLIGNQHPLVIFISVLGGVAVMGSVGLILGPVSMAVLAELYKYIDQKLNPTPENVVELEQPEPQPSDS